MSCSPIPLPWHSPSSSVSTSDPPPKRSDPSFIMLQQRPTKYYDDEIRSPPSSYQKKKSLQSYIKSRESRPAYQSKRTLSTGFNPKAQALSPPTEIQSSPFGPSSSPSSLMTFTKEDFDNAPLTCQTSIDCERIRFGFTAGMEFRSTDILNVTSTKFLHDQTTLQLLSDLTSGRTLKTELRYSSFCKLNFKINKNRDVFRIALIIVVNHAPLFFWGEKEVENDYLTYHRYNPKNETPAAYWNKLVGARAFRVFFSLSATEMQAFFGQLFSLLSCPITYGNEEVRSFDIATLTSEELQQEMVNWSWEICYRIDAIKSIGTVGCYFLNYQLFEQKKIDFIRQNVQRNHHLVVNFLNAMYEHLKNDLSLSSLDIKDDQLALERTLRDEYVLIKTVYVTPTQTLFTLDEATMDCRGFRKLGIENLIQVKFRDETNDRFPRELASETILPFCRNGINIGKRHFYEFGASSSLFREYGSYFYATDDKKNIVQLWEELGDFKIEPASKVGARIGLYFTSARKFSMKISQKQVLLVDDLMSKSRDTDGNPYCFSDGCGIISPVFAKIIAGDLDIPYVPSAFQIRYAGYKGMVSVDTLDDRLLGNGGEYYACLRKSQKKFDVSDKRSIDFDIAQWAGPSGAKFHQCFIATLDSLALKESKQRHKELHHRLRHLLNESFTDILKPLVDSKAFVSAFERLPKYFPLSKMLTSEQNCMQEPFLRSMIEAKATFNARMLAKKSQIPIPPELGRMALGVVDTTGILEEGQVFFQFSDSLNPKSTTAGKSIKVGPIGVTKSPIYHAGDIRFLTAIDVPELNHLVDVLVFPSKGSRPHPDEIGGGDLDGDIYLIFWDEAFLLSGNHPATDFTPPYTDHIPKVSLKELQEEHPEFRVQYIKEENLAYLSNCHLSHLTTLSTHHPDCEKLAKKADKAVNFFKSGLASECVQGDEKTSTWPKFMGKRHEPSFTDTHILSELHDHASTFYHLIQIAQQEAQKHRPTAPSILLDVNEADRKFFLSYKNDIHNIMNKYQIKSEGELFSNAFLDVSGTLNSYRNQVTDDLSTRSVIQSSIFEIFERYRIAVLNMFSKTWKYEMDENQEDIFNYKLPNVPQKMVDLAKTFYNLAEEDGTCYSFPWIAWEGLDLWWTTNDTRTPKDSIVKRLESESFLYFLSQKHLPNVPPSVERMKADFLRFPWFQEFTNIVFCWIQAENFDNFTLNRALTSFMKQFVQNDEERSMILTLLMSKTGGNVFLDFLGMIISSGCNLFGLYGDEKKKFYKAAQSTLVKLAFFPESDAFFNTKLQDQIITYPSFVISIPIRWSNEFLQKYKCLEEKSGCTEVAIGLRKTFTFSHSYTIMCRGSLEACQKLEAMLTPVIKGYGITSMKQMKKHKLEKMNDLLQEMFDFPPRLLNSIRPHHIRTSTVRLIHPRASSHRGMEYRPINHRGMESRPLNHRIVESRTTIQRDVDLRDVNHHHRGTESKRGFNSYKFRQNSYWNNNSHFDMEKKSKPIFESV